MGNRLYFRFAGVIALLLFLNIMCASVALAAEDGYHLGED